ncbi:MAG: DNA internalization-related competence protein ComEC/Rec2 [Chromatiales bacterium]|nr:DNA internalization-related competence protein ComEC/Rec2 [Chromatiales bacterium]
MALSSWAQADSDQRRLAIVGTARVADDGEMPARHLHGRQSDRPAPRRTLVPSALAAVAGSSACFLLASLPPKGVLYIAGGLVLPGLWRGGRGRIGAAFVAAFVWTALFAHARLEDRLDPGLVGADLEITGTVRGLPQAGALGPRFDLETGADRPAGVPERLRLRVYADWPAPQAGERWRLVVRLREPFGLANPGGYDHAAMLFRDGIGGTGYVRDSARNERLAVLPWWRCGLDCLRADVRDRLAGRLDGQSLGGVLIALVVGERGAITDEQWDVLRTTGTAHLMAISGLHVGLVGGLGFAVVAFVWRLAPGAAERIAARRVAAGAALIVGFGYAALAGFALPTRRALVMLAVWMGALMAARVVRPSRVLAIAALATLAVDPFAPLSAGFWLSFGAVAVIVWVVSARIGPTRGWRTALRIQFALALGMLPLTAMWFGGGSLAGPPANLLAVPVVGLGVVPLALLGTAFLTVWPAAAGLLLDAADGLLGWTWGVLEFFAALPSAWMPLAPPGPLAGAMALLGGFWLLAPRGVPARLAAVVLLLPAFVPRDHAPTFGALRMDLLDVGQGLAAIVRTATTTLVFDAGPRRDGGFDAGESVVVPALQLLGVRRVDRFVVSHDNRDHSGGAGAVRQAFPPVALRAGESIEGEAWPRCRQGERWSLDGVGFEFLWPPPALTARGNNASCVLRIEAAGRVVLLTGDIERDVERALVAGQGEGIAADVVVVPHHGSASSSTRAFVAATAPRWALVPAGHRNRWGFPRPEIVARWQAAGSRVRSTGDAGALRVEIAADGGIEVRAHRNEAPRFWRRPAR